MFFNFNFHRCKPVTGEDFILKLIPSVFTEFSRKFLLRHHMFHRNNGKITDIGSMFASGLLRPCFWNFITVCSALRKRFNRFSFIKIHDVAIDFHKTNLVLGIQLFGRPPIAVVVQYSDLFQ